MFLCDYVTGYFWNDTPPPPTPTKKRGNNDTPVPPPLLIRIIDGTRSRLEKIPPKAIVKIVDLLAMAVFSLYFTYTCGYENWHLSLISFTVCWFSAGMMPKIPLPDDLEDYWQASKNLMASPGAKAIATSVALLVNLIPKIGPTAAITTFGLLGVYVNRQLELTPQKILSMLS